MRFTVKRNDLLKIFLTMMKIGFFTFGGGYAMLSLLEHEFVEKKEWLSRDEFLDMAAIAESTPGPIAINAATYIGYKQCGFLGSLLATVAVCIPSFLIIFAISLCLDAFLTFKPVYAAFRGIQVCVVYLIFSAGFKMLKKMKKTPKNIITVVTVSLVMLTFSVLSVNFSSIFYILICGTVGVALYLLKPKGEKK